MLGECIASVGTNTSGMVWRSFSKVIGAGKSNYPLWNLKEREAMP